MDDDVERFVAPVMDHLDDVTAELTSARKRTHWMWFVFPQLRSLGRSDSAVYFGLLDLAAAREFLRHPFLGPTYERLVGMVHDVVLDEGHGVHDVFGSPDDWKLVSSLTLFRAAARAEGMTDLESRCDELLDAAQRQGLPACAATLAAVSRA